MSRGHPQQPHAPGCLCSSCHLSSKLFPRGPNDRIILPAIRPTPTSPLASPRPEKGHKSSRSHSGIDRSQFAPPRPQSTAPREYRQRPPDPPVPVPAMPTPAPRGYGYAAPGPSSSSSSTPHRSAEPQRGAPPHRPVAMRPEPASYTFCPPDRPASAMAAPMRPQPGADSDAPPGNLEWMPPRLKWVKKKERVSHFTPPSQYQGTSFRQYVHDGVSSR
ncbi:hypothetical protein C8J57DRAFT_1260640 [Mycena rebaudengoi]|nr:hypothetical protein C8J57DRAFT_1260640 [Mycena rebaudengoi]